MVSRFQDIEDFARQHRSCGTLTPTASSPIMGGYLLTLTCSCGRTLDRWVTAEESQALPAAMAPPAPAGPELPRAAPPRPKRPPKLEPPPAVPRSDATLPEDPREKTPPPPVHTLPTSSGESLDDLMKRALEAVDKTEPAPRTPDAGALEDALRATVAEFDDAPTTVLPPRPARPTPRIPTGPPSIPAPPPAAPPTAAVPPSPPAKDWRSEAARSAVVEPPPGSSGSRSGVGGPEMAPHTIGPRSAAVAPPSPASTPVPPRAPTPPRHAATTPAKPKDTPAPSLDRQTLEEVMKRALEEVEAESRKPGPKREKPDRRSLEEALRHALDDFDEENRQAAAGHRPLQRQALAVTPGAPLETVPPQRRQRLSVATALVIAAVLVAGATGWYLAQPQAPAIVATTTRPARPPVTEADRAAVGQSVAVLRDLLSVSRADVASRVYANRVSFAKADLERYAPNVKDPELRVALRNALSLHLLAAAAWRAKTFNERDKWEVVGDDPAVELCPAAKRLLSVSDEPPNMTRAQWRGVVLAAGIPVLWDCALERVADIEKSLKDR